MVDLDKICNIAGYPIYKWTARQLQKRSQLGSVTTQRTDDNLGYLANKNAWVRVISSVDLNKSIDQPGGHLTKHIKGLMPNSFIDISKENLSKNFILYGGTSTWANNGMNLRSGVGAEGAYGTLGGKEITEFGYKPMPGITSLEIETLGRLGSFRQAIIKLKVHDKQQLDLIDTLYFRLGYSIIIEWGHSKYYDNSGHLQSSEQYMIDPYKSCKTPEEILININTNVQKSYGNYGGMFGVITNFEYSFSQDGGYDCTIKVYAPGITFGSLPINRPSILSKVYENQLNLFLNNERDKRIREKKRELELKEQEDLENLSRTLDKGSWAEVVRKNEGRYNTEEGKIDPYLPGAPVATLLYNTRNLGDIEKLLSDEAAAETVYGVTTGRISTKVSDYKDKHTLLFANYYDRDEVDPYNATTLASKISDYYKIEDKGEGDMIYFLNFRKYITPNKKITVKLDLDRINVLMQREGYKNIQEVLKDISIGTPEGFAYGEVEYGGISNSSLKFTISYELNGPAVTRNIDIKSYLENKNTEYEIADIDWRDTKVLGGTSLAPVIKLTVVNNPNIIVYLGGATNGLSDLNPTSVFLGDLRLIKDIKYPSDFEDLTKTKDYENYKIARGERIKKTSDELETLLKQIEVDMAKIRKTLDSESALELMLRSVQLYGLTGDESAKVPFIKQLFSEGAYSEFFKDGYPSDKGLPSPEELIKRYTNAKLTKKERLLVNLLYGNNYQLLSCENVYDSSNQLKKGILGEIIPKVNFEDLLKISVIDYGDTPLLETVGTSLDSDEYKKSVYMTLGSFFLMLNHTAILYTKDRKNSDVTTPFSYVDFNPNTNYYLSSINQISIDRRKFLVGYYGDIDDYKKLFDKSLIDGNNLVAGAYELVYTTDTWESKKIPTTQATLFNPKTEDALTYYLPKNSKKDLKGKDNVYVGRLMDVYVNVSYLLNIIKQYAISSNTHEVYFQTVIERILDDLNTSMGGYNAFRLSYNDNSNCYVITDDQIQPADPMLINGHSEMISNNAYEIPVYGKSSIARNLEVRTDLSGRISSVIAISANPTLETQVGLGKDASDFGVYNLGTEDRYKRYTADSTVIGENKEIGDNAKMAELAANFNDVVRKTYRSSLEPNKSLSEDEISKATNYYLDRMSYVKNAQSGSVHSLIIPMKSAITMDGVASLYPFQLYTISENVMPYRYSVSNLNKRVAYSISKVVHTFQNNEWVTKIEGFMTLLKDKSYYISKSKLRDTSSLPKRLTANQIMRAELDTSPVKTEKYPKILTPEFLKKLGEVCNRLGCKVDDMLRVMYAESRFDPTAKSTESSAAGLIQITQANYNLIGVRSRQELATAPALKQLDYVEKYFERFKGKLGDIYLLYGATFLPYLVQYHLDEDNYVLGENGSDTAVKNPSMQDAEGKITIASFKQYVKNISYEINQ